MNIVKEKIEELLAGSFTHELIEVTLTQQTNENPKMFTGSGFFYYKNNKIHLKFLHKETDAQFSTCPTYNHLDYGEIIGSEYLFSMNAIDLNGYLWQAKDVDPYVNINASQQGVSIDCELYEIKRKIDGDFKKHKVIFFIPQKINIPCNEFQDLGEEGKRRTRSVFSLNNINVSILLEDKYTRICLDSDDDFSYLYAKSILDSLSVASGVLLNPALVLWQGNDSRLLIFKHIDNKEKQRLMTFIPQRAPYYLNEWVQFSQAYIKKFETDKTFYYYWRKIFNAHQSDLENETLSLTVSIEGVINKFYSTFKIEDVEFSSLCCESKPVIENLEINERVKSSIIQLLEKGGRSSVKGTLFNMAKKGFFPEELATTWYKARNRSAHAKHFKEHSWQENVKNYNSCLTLFYMLLCYHIEYKGKFVHHHLPGAPLKNLTE